jgi:hypothetical protein
MATQTLHSTVRARLRHRLLICVLQLIAIALLPYPCAHGAEAAHAAESVKAAYLYHFGTYVDWNASGSAEGTITIGIAGSEAILAELRRILPGRTIQNRPLNLREVRKVEDLSGVNILYVANGELGRSLAIPTPRTWPLLVVTDWDSGLDQGGIINFVMQDNRIRFEISLAAADQAELKLSSRLLSAAIRVKRSYLQERTSYAMRATPRCAS